MTKNSKPSPSYHIGTVSRLTGLSTHTIRVWERRYEAVIPARSPGGTREYSETDVAKLSLLKTLTDAGHSIGQIAQLDSDALRTMIDSVRRRSLSPLASNQSADRAAVAAFLYALERMDVPAAETALNQAGQLLGPLAMVFDVIAPICERVGARWAEGSLRIAHEHAATAILRNYLAGFVNSQLPNRTAPVAAATTLSGELHELGALMSSYVAKARGYKTVYLGPNLPIGEIAHVVESAGAGLLLLSLVNARTRESVDQLRELLALLPDGTSVIAGGRSITDYTDVLAAEQRVVSLAELYDRLGTLSAASRNFEPA